MLLNELARLANFTLDQSPSKTSLRVYNAYDEVLYLCCNRVPKGWCPVIEEADTCSQAAHDFGGVVLPPLQ